MKALVSAFNQEKSLVGARGLLRDCEIFGHLRITLICELYYLARSHTVVLFQEFGDSARARRLYADDDDDEEEQELEPNPKLAQGKKYGNK